MLANDRRLAGKALVADLLPQLVCVVTAIGPPLTQVLVIRRERARAGCRRVLLGKRVRSQVPADRLPAEVDLLADGDLGEALLMQREHRLVPSQPLRATRLPLLLGTRLAGWCGRRYKPGLRLWWSRLGQCAIDGGCGLAQRGALAREDTLEQFADVRVGWAAGEVPRTRAFSDGLPPNRAGLFPGTRVSRASTRDALPRGTPRVDGDVEIVAGDQGLPLARSHLLDPGRNRPTAMALEVLQVAHVVDLHAVA